MDKYKKLSALLGWALFIALYIGLDNGIESDMKSKEINEMIDSNKGKIRASHIMSYAKTSSGPIDLYLEGDKLFDITFTELGTFYKSSDGKVIYRGPAEVVGDTLKITKKKYIAIKGDFLVENYGDKEVFYTTSKMHALKEYLKSRNSESYK
jgi:hypothetical protein